MGRTIVVFLVGVVLGVCLVPPGVDVRPLYEDELGWQCMTYEGLPCDMHTPVDDIVVWMGEDYVSE